MLNLIIVGAGGFGGEVMQYARDTFDLGSHRIKGFLDDKVTRVEHSALDAPVLGTINGYLPEPEDRFLLAVGDPGSRLDIAARLAAHGAQFLTLIHPLAYVASSATLGAGCIISPFATVGARAKLGAHVVLTFYASVGHDAQVGACCALSPHSVTNGGSVLGQAVFLGSHAAVNPLKRVGDGAKVAAGAVVYRNVPPHSLAAGNPAKARPLMRQPVKAQPE